jgi:hypothetical protein
MISISGSPLRSTIGPSTYPSPDGPSTGTSDPCVRRMAERRFRRVGCHDPTTPPSRILKSQAFRIYDTSLIMKFQVSYIHVRIYMLRVRHMYIRASIARDVYTKGTFRLTPAFASYSMRQLERAMALDLEVAGTVRELTEDERPPPSEVSYVAKLRDSHHALARALARGQTPIQASQATGYRVSRIYLLLRDPTFMTSSRITRRTTRRPAPTSRPGSPA